MRVVEIPKRGGGVRRIYVPTQGRRDEYRKMLAGLRHALGPAIQPCVHGFVTGRSAVTAARAHVGYAYTLSMDIEGWYDGVRQDQIEAGLEICAAAHALLGWPARADVGMPGSGNIVYFATPKDRAVTAEAMCVDGAPRQGLPTSPYAANIAALPMDAAIAAALPAGVVYTRYADDLAFSGNDRAALLALRATVAAIVAGMGWRIKERKTRLQSAAYGNRIVCGVSVGPAGLACPRRFRRRARAAAHGSRSRAGARRARGMAAWVEFCSRA